MGITKASQRAFHLSLYAGMLQTVTLLKRNDDQQEGTVTSYVLFNCRRSRVNRAGEPIQAEEGSMSASQWHIPRVELDRVGVKFLNVLDRIIDTEEGYPRYWTPEAVNGQVFSLQLLGDWYTFNTSLVNPPSP